MKIFDAYKDAKFDPESIPLQLLLQALPPAAAAECATYLPSVPERARGPSISYRSNICPKVAAGEYHTLVLSAGGFVYACGSNYYGQLGSDKPDQLLLEPIMEMFNDGHVGFRIKDIAAGKFHSLLLTDRGEAFAFGQNFFGQLGNGAESYEPTPIPQRIIAQDGMRFTAIDGGDQHTVLLEEMGRVYTVGYNNRGQLGLSVEIKKICLLTYLDRIVPIRAIAAGANHTVLLGTDGHPYAFGDGTRGQLGNGHLAPHHLPQRMRIEQNIIAIAAGDDHTLLLTEDKDVYVCGANYYGQLGLAPINTMVNTPVKLEMGDIKFTAIAGGRNHSLLRAEDGRVYALGFNRFGQLGDGTTLDKCNPVVMRTPLSLGANIQAMAGGDSHSVLQDAGGRVYACGRGNTGQLGQGSKSDQLLPMPMHAAYE